MSWAVRYPGRDPVGEQVWPIFSRSSRRAQEDRDELTRNRAGLESRLGEISAEAQELRVRLSDLEMKAADREAAHSAIQDRLRELEADNRRLAEERDQARRWRTSSAPRWTSERPHARSRRRVIAGARRGDRRAGRARGPGPAAGGGSRTLARPKCSRSRPAWANWKRTIDGWARSGTAPRP